jgi:hypothetical protein
MIVQILQLDKENLNGRIYPREMMEKAIKEWQDRPVLGQVGMSEYDQGTPDLSKVSHYITDLRIENDALIGNVKLVENPNGLALAAMISSGEIVFRPSGTGKILNGIVADYQLTAVNAVLSKDAA